MSDRRQLEELKPIVECTYEMEPKNIEVAVHYTFTETAYLGQIILNNAQMTGTNKATGKVDKVNCPVTHVHIRSEEKFANGQKNLGRTISQLEPKTFDDTGFNYVITKPEKINFTFTIGGPKEQSSPADPYKASITICGAETIEPIKGD